MDNADVPYNVRNISFNLDIPNISQLDAIESHDVKIQGIPWKLNVLKRIKDAEKYLGIYLNCAKSVNSSNWSHAASASFKLLSFGKNTDAIEYCVSHVFNSKNSNYYYGVDDLIAWHDLFDETKLYVKDDMIRFEIKIEVEDPNEKNKSDIFIKCVDKCCKDSSSVKYRLTVTNIQNLVAVRTPTLELCHHSYYLTAFKNHSNQFGVSLESNDLRKTYGARIIITSDSSEWRYSIHKCETKQIEDGKSFILDNLISFDELLKPENGVNENINSINIEIELLIFNINARKRYVIVLRDERPMKRIALECPICSKITDNQEVSCSICGHSF